MYWTVDNVFQDFQSAYKTIKGAKIRPYVVPNDKTFFVSDLEPQLSAEILRAAEQVTGKRFNRILEFIRLNTNKHDSDFRVHTDKLIFGQYPTHACITYIETVPGTGTALFEHPKHGRSIPYGKPNNIVTVDDGQWSPYFQYESKANTTFVYEANYYHGRYPWEAYGSTVEDGRRVVVTFLKAHDEQLYKSNS